MTCFLPISCIKIWGWGDRSSWNPQISFQFLHCQLPIFVDCSPYTFNILRHSACCRLSRMWTTVNRFSTIFEGFVLHCYWCCTHCIPESLLNHPNNFCRRMLKLNAKLMQIHCSSTGVSNPFSPGATSASQLPSKG